MNNLFILLLLPVISAVVLLLIKNARIARSFAFILSLVQLVLTLPYLLSFDPSAQVQFEQSWQWISSLNINFHIGIDGISMPLVLMTNVIIPLIILSSFGKDYSRHLYSLIAFMQTGLLMVFVALDAFTFYVGWEIALIPIYFICALWGDGDRIRINLKFFVYTFFGSIFMLIAIIYLAQQTPGLSFEWSSFAALDLSSSVQRWIFWAFFIAFAIKIPIFPLHTWQPATYTHSPTPGTMLLAGVMLKMGTYALIRWLIPIAPLGVTAYGYLAVLLCIIGLVYASIIAFKQYNAKRVIAYSSIAHVGLISAGVFTWSQEGLQGSLFQMVSHAISVVALFFIIDIIQRRTGTLKLKDLGGLAHSMPRLSIAFLIIVMSAVGLPITSGFVGEFLLLKGVYSYDIWFAVFGGLTLIFSAVYMLRLFQKTMLGPVNTNLGPIEDIKGYEVVVLAVLIFFTISLGVLPNSLLSISEASVSQLLEQVKF